MQFSSSTIAPPSADNFLDFDLTKETTVAGLVVTDIAVVPEPASLGMLGLAGLALVVRRTRKEDAA